MEINLLAAAVQKIQQHIKEDLANIKQVKDAYLYAQEFEMISYVRDVEKELLRMQKIFDPLAK